MHKCIGLWDGMSVMCNGLSSVLMPHILNGILTSSTLLYKLSWGCLRKSGRVHTVVTRAWGLFCCSEYSGFSLGQRGLLNHQLDHHPLSHLPHPLGHYWMIQHTNPDLGIHVHHGSLSQSVPDQLCGTTCLLLLLGRLEWEDYQPVCIDGPGGVRAGRRTSVGCCIVKIADRTKEIKRKNKPVLKMVNRLRLDSGGEDVKPHRKHLTAWTIIDIESSVWG